MTVHNNKTSAGLVKLLQQRLNWQDILTSLNTDFRVIMLICKLIQEIVLMYAMNSNGANKNLPYLRSLDVLKKGVSMNGYSESFIYGRAGFISTSNSIVYNINQVKVISMIRFQSDNNSRDHAELYIIETPDGRKGTFEKTAGSLQ